MEYSTFVDDFGRSNSCREEAGILPLFSLYGRTPFQLTNYCLGSLRYQLNTGMELSFWIVHRNDCLYIHLHIEGWIADPRTLGQEWVHIFVLLPESINRNPASNIFRHDLT